MLKRPLAITLDLDDTLWEGDPPILGAEEALDAWFRANAPGCARQFPVPAMRKLRAEVLAANPHLELDFGGQRRLAIRTALERSGHEAELADAAFDVYFAARNAVELYPETAAALARLAAHGPLATLSNGNADVDLIGIGHYFAARISAMSCGVAKPEPAIFRAACESLGFEPGQVLHVGDHPHLDIAGAHGAGMRTAWLNRSGSGWPIADMRPEIEVRDLVELADWLDASG